MERPRKGTDAVTQSNIKSVGIIGAGQMGNGIAHVVALAGFDVAMHDIKKEAVDKARVTIERNMARQVSRGVITDVGCEGIGIAIGNGGGGVQRLQHAPG